MAYNGTVKYWLCTATIRSYDSTTHLDGNLRHLQIILLLGIMTTVAACSTFRFPGVHRITVQQGNVVTQQMLDRLKPGMTKAQVRFVLGNPVIDHSLKAEQWDYVHSLQVQGGDIIRRSLVLHFVDDRLSHFEGDFLPTNSESSGG